MQFPVLVIVPAESDNIIAAVTRLMAPYDMARTIELRKVYVSQDELDYLVEVYRPWGLRADDTDALVAAVADDTECAAGHDKDGIWYMTTDNSDAKWDGWQLDNPQNDIWPATSALPENICPSAIITPDGIWHDLEDTGNMSGEEKTALRARAATLLAAYPFHLAVLLHCHR